MKPKRNVNQLEKLFLSWMGEQYRTNGRALAGGDMGRVEAFIAGYRQCEKDNEQSAEGASDANC